MKVLVLEENEKVTQIYKKIFEQKKIIVNFSKNETELLQRFGDEYDYFILENPILASKLLLNEKHQNSVESKIIILSSFFSKNSEISNVPKETSDLLEKPFAMISVLSKLEIDLRKKAITA